MRSIEVSNDRAYIEFDESASGNARFVYCMFSGITYLSEISNRLRSWIKIRVLGRHR